MVKNDLGIRIPTTIEWETWNGEGKCPKCFGTRFQYNTRVVLTTQPAQTLLRCLGCGYQFGSLALVRSRSESAEPPSTSLTVDTCVLCGEPAHIGKVFCEKCLKALRGVVERATQPISAAPHISLTPAVVDRLSPTESETADSVTLDSSDAADPAEVIATNVTETASTSESQSEPDVAAPKKRSTYKRKTPSTEG